MSWSKYGNFFAKKANFGVSGDVGVDIKITSLRYFLKFYFVKVLVFKNISI